MFHFLKMFFAWLCFTFASMNSVYVIGNWLMHPENVETQNIVNDTLLLFFLALCWTIWHAIVFGKKHCHKHATCPTGPGSEFRKKGLQQ